MHEIPQLQRLPAHERAAMRAVAHVLPFRVNSYVVDELIDWDAAPDDPMFRLVFPQPDMLAADEVEAVRGVLEGGGKEELATVVGRIRAGLNPHPAGQTTLNVARLRDGRAVDGLQHKYEQTVLLFPSAGQTCHTYCTYCFRWAQFVGDQELRMAARQMGPTVEYLHENPQITDVLVTGGDPMVMQTRTLRRFLEPLLQVPSVRTIRIGTKSVAWWPQRFVTDPDADDLMRLFEEIAASGRHLALMAHYSHLRELTPSIAEAAVRRIQATGALIRTQAPLVRHVNDDADTWAELWRRQVALGMSPYYMFMERDTGPRDYFAVPLVRGLRIYERAVAQVSGLGRTARGPVMSCTPGKVLVAGQLETPAGTQLALKMIQARNPDWVGRLFLARSSDTACWIDQLEPASGDRFFFDTP